MKIINQTIIHFNNNNIIVWTFTKNKIINLRKLIFSILNIETQILLIKVSTANIKIKNFIITLSLQKMSAIAIFIQKRKNL